MERTIRAALETVSTFLRKHPDAGGGTDSSATATIEEGLRVRVTGPNPVNVLVSDMVTNLGGGASAPSPGWLLRAAHAACDATLIAMRAAQEGITLHRVEVMVTSESDDRGLLGVEEGIPAGPLLTRVAIRVSARGVDEARVRAMVAWAEEHSPVEDAIRRAVPVHVTLEMEP